VAIPDFQTAMRPVLIATAADEPQSYAQIRDHVAAALDVSDAERQVMLPSGYQELFANRVAWAVTHLSRAGLLDRPRRGRYVLSERGRKVLAEHPGRIDTSVLMGFPEYREFRARKKDGSQDTATPEIGMDVADEFSPSEAIGRIVMDSEAALAAELLDRVVAQPPIFLEKIALDLLAKMGFGGKEILVEHTGKSGDEGLDGIIRQDALGLDLIGLQAKRYAPDKKPVSREDIQAFVGALHGKQATRGVFVTTGRFTSGAKQYAENVPVRLRLIDGDQLVTLMIRYGVGVQVKEIFELKQIDEDTFEE